MSDWSHEIEIASLLARQAGRRIMTIYGQDFAISYKGTNDPVTEADQEANTIIVEGLATHFPKDGIIAEESPLPIEAQTADRVWYVDPLDGSSAIFSETTHRRRSSMNARSSPSSSISGGRCATSTRSSTTRRSRRTRRSATLTPRS